MCVCVCVCVCVRPLAGGDLLCGVGVWQLCSLPAPPPGGPAVHNTQGEHAHIQLCVATTTGEYGKGREGGGGKGGRLICMWPYTL